MPNTEHFEKSQMRALQEQIDRLTDRLKELQEESVPEIEIKIQEFFENLKEEYNLQDVSFQVEYSFDEDSGHEFCSTFGA